MRPTPRLHTSHLPPWHWRHFILHLSDLHFGVDYGFRRQGEDVKFRRSSETLTDCISADLSLRGLPTRSPR